MEIKNKKPEVRFLKEMEKVVFDRDFAKKFPNLELYYMYRGVKKKGELRYDITDIPPQMLGKELTKTKGNRNSKNFSELYTVLKGGAILLMQKMKGKTVKDVVAFKLKKGDYVIIPPKYHVITINPSKKSLKIANWVSEKNENIYKELETMQGACYYYIKSGWIKNKNYKKIPKLRFKKPLKKMPKNLDFLKGRA